MTLKKIYFVRHGQTIFNKMNKIQGSSDIELSEEGKKQALDVKLDEKNFDMLVHSGLKRSKETLDIIKENLNLEGLYQENDLVIERGYGIFEGFTKNDIKEKYSNLYEEWIKNENAEIENAESIESVISRFLKFIEYIKSSEFDNILAVTHSGFLYAIYKYITNTNLGIRPLIKFPNCCVTVLLVKDNNKLEFIVGDETYVN